MLTAIQVYEVYRSEAEARQGLAFQAEQVGYLGGRVLPPSPEKPDGEGRRSHADRGEDHDAHERPLARDGTASTREARLVPTRQAAPPGLDAQGTRC